MAIINPTLPVVGQDRGTEEADVLSALTVTINEINGSLDTNNLDASAGILGSQLSAVAGIVATQLAAAVQQSLVPVGTILPTALPAAPTGYLLCDGSAVSRTGANAALFAAIGTAYGVGDGTTTFNLPDLRGRYAVGKGTDSEVDALGKNDGLAVGARSPNHVHGHAHTHTLNGHTHSINDATGGPSSTTSVPSSGTGSIIVASQTHAHTLIAATSGPSTTNTSGASTSNTDEAAAPYQVVNHMIKL